MDAQYLTELFGLEGKVAVVTGGGGVLCSTMSRALGRMGVSVAVLDISMPAAQKVADSIAAANGTAIAIKCDVLDKASILLDKETGKPLLQEGETDAGEGKDKKVSDEELKRMSAFYDFINTLDLDDFDKRKS